MLLRCSAKRASCAHHQTRPTGLTELIEGIAEVADQWAQQPHTWRRAPIRPSHWRHLCHRHLASTTQHRWQRAYARFAQAGTSQLAAPLLLIGELQQESRVTDIGLAGFGQRAPTREVLAPQAGQR